VALLTLQKEHFSPFHAMNSTFWRRELCWGDVHKAILNDLTVIRRQIPEFLSKNTQIQRHSESQKQKQLQPFGGKVVPQCFSAHARHLNLFDISKMREGLVLKKPKHI